MIKRMTQMGFGLIAVVGFAATVQAAPAKFNHSGIQKGKVIETCYHSPCSVAKFVSYKQLNKTATESKIQVTLLGGSREWEAKKIDWNRSPHKVTVNCSYKRPTVQIGSQKTLIPLNDGLGVPGVLMVDAELYLYVCHKFEGSIDKAVQKYGYNVQDDE